MEYHKYRGAGFFCLAAIVSLLSGCTTLGLNHSEDHNKEQREQFDFVDKHSSFPAVNRDNFEHVHLLELIDPEREYIKFYKAPPAASEGDKDGKPYVSVLNKKGTIKEGIAYDWAFAAFREKVAKNLSNSDELEKLKLHRNSVQDRILAVSASRCNVFKTYLRREQSDTNFLLGSSTTIAGVLGSLVTGADASRVLSGAAGILSGVQAEYNSDYYSNLAAQVITQGIDLRQNQLLDDIVKERQVRSVAVYSMEAAVKDALVYDGMCSTVTGLQVAAESIKEQDTPSFAQAVKMMTAVKAAGDIAKADNLKDLPGSELDKLTKLASPKVSPLVVKLTKPAPAATFPDIEARITAALEAKVKKDNLIKEQEDKVLEIFDKAVSALKEDEKSKVTVKRDDIKTAFDQVRVNIGKDDAAPTLTSALNECVSKLDKDGAVLDKYGKAKTAMLKTLPSTPERIAAQKQLDIAKAETEAVLLKVETVFAAIQTIAQAPAVDWATALKKPMLTKEELGKLTVPTADPAVAALCQ